MAAYRTAAEILSLISDDKSEQRPLISDERQQLYRRAAAVLVSLKKPDWLQPVSGKGKKGEGAAALSEELIPATGKEFEGKVMLHPDARRRAIAELSTVEARQKALMANPDERAGTLQTLLERYLLNDPIPLNEQPPEQLDETLQIVTWLDGTLDNLPSLEDVKARLAFRSYVTPLESIAGDNIFRGRRRELDQLRAYVGVLPPEALLSRIREAVYKWVRPSALPALSISGPGGIGKSALVARFILEHCRIDRAVRIPLAYLDFDRAVLSISEPETILMEILNQLVLEFAEEAGFRELRDSFQKEIATQPKDLSVGTSDTFARLLNFTTELMIVIEDRLGPRPFVIVLDTFEEVQYRGESLAYPLWEIFDQMQQSFPFLRIVVSGRAPVTSLRLGRKDSEKLVLGDLDNEAAVGYLKGLGINDSELAQMLIKQLGGVPLSLKLAAAVVKRDGIDTLSDVSRRSSFFSSTSDSAIQGVLFARILGHLHDPVLERLAHPGLVLRRLSPAVILNVLNEPCELRLTTEQEAKELFDKLSRETSLVASDTLDGTLVHRSELRRIMLRLLVEKEPDKAAQINRKAAEWYANQTGWRAKAEELYHRLQLRQTTYNSWFDDPEVRASLQNSVSELPLVSQTYLATLGYQIDSKILAEASRQDRETALAAEVEEHLPYGPRSVAQAESVLRDFKGDHASPLFAAAARVAMQQGRDEDADEHLEKGIQQAFLDFNSEQALALLAEKVWLKRHEVGAAHLADTVKMFGQLAREYKHQTSILQYRIQTYTSPEKPEVTAASGEETLREIASLLTQASSYDLWSLFLLLEQIVPSLDEKTQTLIMRSICEDDGPFLKVQFFSTRPQMALNDLLQISSGQSLNLFAAAVKDLCDVWPFRILRVKPPYSSRVFGHDSSVANA